MKCDNCQAELILDENGEDFLTCPDCGKEYRPEPVQAVLNQQWIRGNNLSV